MNIEKSTHEPYRTELFVPIMKGTKGKYMAVLSDNSTDRDEESLSKSCVESLGQDDKYLVALVNHKNDVFMQVAEWTNKGIKEIDGYTALIAEPRFFMSNPNAKIIKGMLDEGAKIGISIGAIVKNYDEIDGKRMFTDLELLEASFVAIPSNRHGRAMLVAKSFNKNMEAAKVDKEFTQKDIDSAVEKSSIELKADFEKSLAEKSVEIEKLNESIKKAEEDKEKAEEAAKEESEASVKEAEEKEASLKSDIEKIKKEALEKQKYADNTEKSEASQDDADKAFKDGKVPIMHMMR